MESLYLNGFTSPIESAETRRFLRELAAGNTGETITINGKSAMVTAVYDSNGTVYMLSLNAATISGSIPVDDPHEVPVPRSPEYFRSPLLRTEQYGDVIGVAAYKFVTTPSVVVGNAERAVGVLA